MGDVLPVPRSLNDVVGPENKVSDLDAQMAVVRRNFEELNRRKVNRSSVPPQAIRMGTDGSSGSSSTSSASDHVHAIDPVLIVEQQTGPNQLTANVNDWQIDALNQNLPYTFYRIDSSGAVNVTGIDGGQDGRILILLNKGGNTITFKHQDANSSSENRFKFSTGADIALAADGILTLIYEFVPSGPTGSRWRNIAKSA